MSTHLVASPRTTVGRIRLDLPPRSHPFQVIRTRIQRGMKKEWKRKPNRTWSRCFLRKKERVAPSTLSRDPWLCPSLSSPLDRAARTGHARARTGAPRSAGHGRSCPLGRVFVRIDPDVRSSAAEDRKRQAEGSPSQSRRRIWDEWFVCAGNGGRSNSHGARAS